MQVINYLYEVGSSIDSLAAQCANHSANQCLIQVYSSNNNPDYLQKMLSDIHLALPGAAIIGVTTAGEILAGESLTDKTVFSVSLFDDVQVETVLVQANDGDVFSAGAKATLALKRPETKGIVVFAAGMSDGRITNGEPLLQGISSVAPDLMVAGGQSANYSGKVTYVYNEHGISSTGFVIAALHGEQLRTHCEYSLGWVPIGKTMTITECDGNRIVSMDNRPVAEVYRHYLGDEVAEGLPMSAVDFPLVFQQSGVDIARHANYLFDDGSMDFLADFSVGDQVRFAYCHAGAIQDNTVSSVNNLLEFQPEAVFVYSCVCRKWNLGKEVRVELGPLEKVATNAGFYAFGEYYHHGSDNLFLTQANTMLALSEQKQSHQEVQSTYTIGKDDSRHFNSLRVLHNLIEQSTRELEKANAELEQLAETDSLTGVANKRKLLLNLSSEMRRAERTGRPLTLVMIDVDHFKEFNDSYGHVAGDECLKLVADCISMMAQRPGDLVARYGGEEFCCLMPLTDNQGATIIADKIRASVEMITLQNPALPAASNVTVSLGVFTLESTQGIGPDQAIERADRLLYEAKNQGRNRVCSASG